MINNTALAFVNEFNRVFYSDDMILTFLVRGVDNGGQGGGFSATGRSGHHHQPPRKGGQLGDDRRQAELLGYKGTITAGADNVISPYTSAGREIANDMMAAAGAGSGSEVSGRLRTQLATTASQGSAPV